MQIDITAELTNGNDVDCGNSKGGCWLFPDVMQRVRDAIKPVGQFWVNSDRSEIGRAYV